MSDETTTDSEGAAAAAAPAKTTAPAAAAPSAPGEAMVSAALLREAQADATGLRAQLDELQAALQTMTSERDTAMTSNRRMSIRLASGIDDDGVADIAHSRYSTAMQAVDEAQRVSFGDWWSGLASNDEARAAQPKALQIYLQPASPSPAPSAANSTPAHTARRTPRPGGHQTLSVADFQRLDSGEQAAVAADFWSRGRRRTR